MHGLTYRHQLGKMSFVLLLMFAYLAAICSVGEGAACNFDYNLCNYTQDTTDQFDWVRQSGSTSTDDTGPDADHTYGTSFGYYVYTDGSFPQTAGEIARLIGPSINVFSSRCLQFYYYMHGDNMGSLRVHAGISATSNAIWSLSGNQGRQWYRGVATIDPPPGASVQVVFEAVVGSGRLSDIAIDDVEVLDGECPIESLSCDFENGMCGFSQDNTDNFDFLRINGETPTINTGPGVDHTFDNDTGYYIYIETSGFLMRDGYKARIISPKIRGLQGNDRETFCLVFWYYMHGQTVSELNVFLRNESSSDLGRPIWGMAGTRGDRWRGAEVELNTPEDFNVIFEATRGGTFQSDIAIDDIEITNYACPGYHIVNNISSVSCDFEEVEICYYTQDPTNDIDWIWRNRGSPDGFTGPAVDHTTANELGFFMYVSSDTGITSADRALLMSPIAKRQSASSCVEFWYHMYGRDVETLNVYVKPESGSLPSSPAWSITGNQGNYWHRATFDIPAFTNDYRVVFEGIPGDQERDDIAIDDVMLYEAAPCPIFTTIPPLPVTQPRALNSIDCDFEDDFCGYEQEYENDQADWARERGQDVSSVFTRGPRVDHTLGTDQGYYATFDPAQFLSLDRYDVAMLVSPFVQASSRPRCVQFYAFMYGANVDYLNLYIRPWGTTPSLDPQFSIFGNIANEWRLYGMDVLQSNENFHVLFEANIGRFKGSGKIAIDDVSLVDGMCTQNASPTPPPWGADCDFEQDETLCGYTQRSSDAFDWTWHQGSTGSTNTGPSTDHTLGTAEGHYVYIETSLPQRPGNLASLISPVLNSQNTDMCLRFYYHAMGEGDIGTLRVRFKLEGLSSLVELFRVTESKGDRWIPVNIDMPASLTGYADFEVRFNGYKGNSLKGDIAIDDIKFLRQPCEGYATEGRCSFEQGIDYCGFTLRTEDDVNYPVWNWYDLLAIEESPLPNITSTSFMYSTSNTRNISTVMYSATYELHARDHCLTSRVLLLNDDNMQLSVSVQIGTNGQRKTIDIITDKTGSDWVSKAWTLASDFVDGPFRLVFTATIGSGSAGIIAIDDVNFTPQSGVCGQDVGGPQERSGSSGENPGLIAGIIIVLLLLIAVIIVAVMVRLRTSYTGKLPIMSFKKNKLDEQPVMNDNGGDNPSGITATSFSSEAYNNETSQA